MIRGSMAVDPFKILGSTQSGAYQVEEVVGEGGFAVVYRAHHIAFRAKVALKCLKVPDGMSEEQKQHFLERFRAEGELLFRLSSAVPAVVRPLHVGVLETSDQRFVPFIALEWLEGETLAELLEARVEQGAPPLGLKECLRLLAPVALALERAHRFPDAAGEICILHRDIKPDNVFVCRVHGQTTCKILDFGIGTAKSTATKMVGQQSASASGLQAFTPAYAAPEQWLPKRFGQTGPWTDVFGFALTLVEVLCGHAPLDGDPAALLGSAIDPERRPTPRNEGATVSDSVERVFQKALAVDPQDRYRDVGAFWAELARAAGLDTTGLSLPPPAHDPRLEGNVKVPTLPPAPGPGLAVNRGSPTVASVPDLDLPAPAPRRASPRAATPRSLTLDADDVAPLLTPIATNELDGVGLTPRSVPLRPRVARAAPLDSHVGTQELGRQLGGPVKLVLFGVAIMAADLVYSSQMGGQLALGPIRPFFIAGPLVLFGVALGVTRLIRD